MKVFKQVLGIDVAQKELVVTLGRLHDDLTIELYAYDVFKNTDKGFLKLSHWVDKLTDKAIKVRYVMEATGVYHQKFAYYLDQKEEDLSIVLPNKISNYMRTLDVKTITDKTCSEAIARFGLERKLDNWKKPKEIYRTLKQLTRERRQITDERTIVKNQLHAEETEAMPSLSSIERSKRRIHFLNTLEKEIKIEIQTRIKDNKELAKDVSTICTIPGISILTAATIIGETNGFELIRNKKQLTSYAGLDVKEKLSGTSVKGKPTISKKGNRYLRSCLHLPALSTIKWDDNFRNQYARIVAKHGIKMKGCVAVQRKLLELVYVIYKNKTIYDNDFESKKNSVPA
ncbi:IS110 family transposase [Flavobacterium sp. LS1R49]|uniref:IS110 family transposase n=1 Tax=Flavobacterium shii TaxID=2987687 RepID=A0A9X3C894_9FLAO|nr:IS110 family transposase [Flavobacterium shii]MCV9930643.1 IS110 family transposase [Flavobacterium shii]